MKRLPLQKKLKFNLLVSFMILVLTGIFPSPGFLIAGGDTEEQDLSAEKVVSLDPCKASFKIIRGKGEGKVIPMTLEPVSDTQNQYILAFEGLYRLHILRASDGSLQVSSLELLEKNKRISYRPNLVLIPPQLAAGETIRKTGEANIYNMKTGEEDNAGDYCFIIEGLSHTTFNTPAGTIKGCLIEYTFRIDLKYSNVILEMENGWSEDRNLVYYRSKTTVKKLGLFGETTFRSLAVCDRPED